ncbi:hypothetical protein ACFWEJ_13145 [Promicromonospora sp. NPDC060204]|uniref:hypothetical protein n=1 Tax=Promicromonospora sp. NPDC060204 TaxID=3347071 RepID=UPI003666A1F0
MLITSTRAVFTSAIILMLLGGAVIVATQVAGLVAGRGTWLTAVTESVGPPTLVAASIAGILAFALSYAPGAETDDDVRDDTEHPAPTDRR